MMDSKEYERMSVILSQYLELNYTRSPEDIDIIRKAYVLKGYLQRCEQFSLIYVGSFAEGFTLRGSDLDQMTVLENVIVMFPYWCIPPNSAHKTILYTSATDCRPGYVYLQPHQIQHRDMGFLAKTLVQIDNSKFVSSDSFRGQFVDDEMEQSWLKCESNGPALGYKTCTSDHVVDIVPCFPCHGWPEGAEEWITRPRLYGWPNRTMIDNIVHRGCHLVPVGDKCSENTFLQWRISFAAAESYLVHSFSHIQFKIYALLKYLLKQIKETLEETIGDDDILSSYFLKTILFHAIENSNQVFWKQKNLFYCFCFCIKILIAWVKAGYCPNYFIPVNNLFRRKVQGRHRQILLDVLSNCYQMKWMCLSVGNFFKPSIWERLCNSPIQTQLLIPTTTRDKALGHDRTFMYILGVLKLAIGSCEIRLFRKAINLLLTSQSELDEVLTFSSAMNGLHALATEQAYPEHMVATDNKTSYRSLRKCKNWMIHSTSMGTERLRLATFYFLTGNFLKSQEVCTKVMTLSQYYYEWHLHPELKAEYSKVYHQFEHTLGRLKRIYAGLLRFEKKELYLPHLYLEMLRAPVCLDAPPLPYALFLTFLCCHELEDTTGRDAALRLLIETKSDDNQGGHHFWIVHTFLGICYQILGDNQMALRAYVDSTKTKSEWHLWNPAIERIAVVYLCMYASQWSERR